MSWETYLAGPLEVFLGITLMRGDPSKWDTNQNHSMGRDLITGSVNVYPGESILSLTECNRPWLLNYMSREWIDGGRDRGRSRGKRMDGDRPMEGMNE